MKTNEGIQQNPNHEENRDNRELLMKVMKVISDVKDVDPKKEKIIQRLKDIISKLKKHNVIMQEKGGEDPLQSIDNANSNFNEMVGKVFQVKADIIQLQVKESVNIKNNIDQFNKKVVLFRDEFLKTLPFDYDDRITIDEINDKYKILMVYYAKTKEIEAEANEFNRLEKLFELQKSNYKQVKECENDLKSLKIMWDAIAMVNYQFNDWKSKPWRQIKADQFLETNKLLATQLK